MVQVQREGQRNDLDCIDVLPRHTACGARLLNAQHIAPGSASAIYYASSPAPECSAQRNQTCARASACEKRKPGIDRCNENDRHMTIPCSAYIWHACILVLYEISHTQVAISTQGCVSPTLLAWRCNATWSQALPALLRNQALPICLRISRASSRKLSSTWSPAI